MDSLLDQVEILIKMKVGEPYRLVHIKVRLKQNKTLRLSDTKYLNDLSDRYIQNVENDNHQEIKTEPTIPSEENSDSIYCWNCGTKNPRVLKFCTSCAWEIHRVKSTPGDKMPESTTKIRKELVILGLVLMIFGSGAFIVPIGEDDWTINDMNVFCKRGIVIGEAFSGEQGQENCVLVSNIMVLASFLGTMGVILVIVGYIRKKTIIEK